MTEIFERLESNNKEAVEDAKQTLREQFTKVNDPWLLNGLYEYYLSTNSQRAMEILVNIKEPHHIYLFDRLSDSMKGPKLDIKVQALTLFGYVARRQPTWLYKLQEHCLLRDLLKSLKNEVELLPLLSALLVLIMLLPMIPSAMGVYLKDIFEIFSRLASWNCNPGKFVEDQLIHMQVALYALFLRLYGMFPCNFLHYLRTQYRDKNVPIFVHTVKPMLHTVKMHPALITDIEDVEITTERWKSMGVHDVIVECERFSLDVTEKCSHEYTSGFRSRSGTTNSTIESSYHLQNLKSLAALQMPVTESCTFFTPSKKFNVHTPPISESIPTSISQAQEVSLHFPSRQGSGTSPPEAAMEATPETTPVRDYRTISNRSQPLNSNIARALTTFTSKTRSGSVSTTPSHSQPSSPMHKEPSPFNFSTDVKPEPIRPRISKLRLDKFQVPDTAVVLVEFSRNKNIPNPSSPLRISNAEVTSRHFMSNQRTGSPISLDDEEVLSIVNKNDDITSGGNNVVTQDLDDVSDTKLEQEHGSPCSEGGLHMPNSKSMNNFAKRVQRLRHHSTCNPEPEKTETSTGSSPGYGIICMPSVTVRRAVSCPEMKKSSTNLLRDNVNKALDETEETHERIRGFEAQKSIVCSYNSNLKSESKSVVCSSTQTESFWPYEHLFLEVFPSLTSTDLKPSPDSSPAPCNGSEDKVFPTSIYDTLDHYIEIAVHSSEKDSKEYLKEQLDLLHQQLLFERHRRETHAYRNRRLLSDNKSSRSFEEYNSALRDTIQLQQKDLEDARVKYEVLNKEKSANDSRLQASIEYWQNSCLTMERELKASQDTTESLFKELAECKTTLVAVQTDLADARSDLMDALTEVNIFKQQAAVGEKGIKELEQLHKEILLIGELHLKYQQRLDTLDADKVYRCQLEDVKKACSEDIKAINQQLENKMSHLEAYRSRVLELESIVSIKDDQILLQKQMICVVNEETFKKLEAVESKYQTQLTINRCLEEKILDLWQRWETASKRSANSPDTSSCHEVNVTTTAGISPHSSPLSASLASSEGSTAFHEREVKNLQAIVDQREVPSKSNFEDSEDTVLDTEG